MDDRHLLERFLRQVGGPVLLQHAVDLAKAGHGPGTAAFVVDGERRIVYWDEEAEQLLGLSSEEVLGEHCLKANRCVTCMRGCGISEHGAINGVPLELFAADGSPRRVRKFARGIQAADGTFLGGIELLVPDEPDPVAVPEQRGSTQFHGMVTSDAGLRQAFDIVRSVARTEATVLIRGESGTGKELIARALHNESHRAKGPFLAVNCAALTPSLLEAELFGHVKGAFTGATADRPGLFARADGGTLFLDEVAELPVELQAKLLRVLQERSFTPVGGRKNIEVDVRIVAATHRSLRQRVADGQFREDLLYRLRVVPIYLPPLRARPGDIELLLWHFIHMHNTRGGRRVERVAPDAMAALQAHRWPGNVRELVNVVEYAFAIGRGPELQRAELPPEFREDDPFPREKAAALPRGLDEESLVREALEQAGGHIGRAAEIAGMSRPTFWRKRKKYGI